MKYATRKKNSAYRERFFLTKKLIQTRNALHAKRSCDVSAVNSLEARLSAVISKEAEDAKVRSRAQWFEQGEKPTRYFFRLERERVECNSFVSLFDEDGVEKNEQTDMENILVDFYKPLFTNDALDMQTQTEIIDDLELSLTVNERELCEEILTKD